MTCNNTNPAAAQAFALARIVGDTGPTFIVVETRAQSPSPHSVTAASMGRVRGLLKEAARERERPKREAHGRRFLSSTSVVGANFDSWPALHALGIPASRRKGLSRSFREHPNAGETWRPARRSPIAR